MKKTTHQAKHGRVTVDHHYYRAVQLDFYIPTKIWKLQYVRAFFDTLSQLGGATMFEEETGLWRGQQEKTHVFRVIVESSAAAIKELRTTLRHEIGTLMAALSASKKSAQETMMYTETEITMVMAKNVAAKK